MQSIRSLQNVLVELKKGALFGIWEETLKNETECGDELSCGMTLTHDGAVKLISIHFVMESLIR